MSLRRVASVLSAVAVLLFSATSLLATIVSFPNFSSTTGLTINGSAAVVTTSDGRVMRVVPGLLGQAGSFFSTSTINAATFSTFFQFRFTTPVGNCPADGLVFVVQPIGSNIGTGGGGEGYLGIPRSVGVEFDIFQNAPFDINASHVGILSNGSISTYLGTGPAATATPMTNGDLWSAWIDYDGTTLSVRVSDGSAVRPANAIVSAPINVVATILQSTAFVGFTAGTGACASNHDLIQWQYNDSFSPIGVTTPTPTAAGAPASSPLSLSILALGLAAVAAYQTRERWLQRFRARG
jgi:Legume lectin domain